MKYQIIQLYVQETSPKYDELQKSKYIQSYWNEPNKPYVLPIGTVMFSIESIENDLFIKFIDTNSSFLWSVVFDDVINKNGIEDALRKSMAYASLCFKAETVDCYGDPVELFDYKFDSAQIGFNIIFQQMFLETFGRN